MFYVYTLLDLRKPTRLTIKSLGVTLLYKPYYIGKGSNNRVIFHQYFKNTKHHKDATTKAILSKHSYDDIYIIFDVSLNESEAYSKEVEVISEIGLGNLTNISHGGQGASSGVRLGKSYEEIYGKERASEIREKISESNTDKVHSSTTRAKLSARTSEYFANKENRIKHSGYLTGRKMPASFSENQSKRLMGKELSANHRKNISESKIGTPQTDQHKKNAAFARAKYKAKISINGNSYIVIRSTFSEVLSEYNISHDAGTFYKAIKNPNLLKDQGLEFELIDGFEVIS